MHSGHSGHSGGEAASVSFCRLRDLGSPCVFTVRCRGVTGTVEQVAEAMQPHLGLAPGDGTSVNVAALLTSDAQCT